MHLWAAEQMYPEAVRTSYLNNTGDRRHVAPCNGGGWYIHNVQGQSNHKYQAVAEAQYFTKNYSFPFYFEIGNTLKSHEKAGLSLYLFDPQYRKRTYYN